MLNVKKAIEQRRSVRRFKNDPFPEEALTELLEAARLAPSGCNAQPWRFKIVRDFPTKARLAEAANQQTFILDAPVVLVCCADLRGYIQGTVSGVQDFEEQGTFSPTMLAALKHRAEELKTSSRLELGTRVAANVAIAIEHIVLRAVELGLGTCWMRALNEQAVREIFGWDDRLFVVALLPVGYPAAWPEPKKRLALNELILP
jgi:nitroreductase